MKCGDRGHLTVSGQPCQQNIGTKAAGCLWHIASPEGRKLISLKGGIASRMNRALPATTLEPPFDSLDSIVKWAQQMAHTALTQDVDPRRMAEARGFAQLALSAHSVRTQQQLVEALELLEHGGAAVLLRTKLTEALTTGRWKPQPPRALRSQAPPSEGQG